MEEIEYLEEYEDLILPKALHYLEELPPEESVNQPENLPQYEHQNEPQNDLNPTFSSNAPEYHDSECLPTPNCSTKKRNNRVQIINNEVLKTPAQFKNFFKDAAVISSFPISSDIQQPSPSISYEACSVSFLDRVTSNPVLQRQDKYKNVATVKPNLQRTLSSIIPPLGSPGAKTQTALNTECAPLLDVNISKENTTILGLEVEKHCADDYKYDNLEFDINTEDISDICSDSMNFSDEYNEDIFNLESLLTSDSKKKKLKRKNAEGTDSEVNRKKTKGSKKIRKTGETNDSMKSQSTLEKKKIHSSVKKSKLVVKKNGKKFLFLDRSKFSLKNRNALNNSNDETQGTPTSAEPMQIEANNLNEQDDHTNNPENISSEKQENIISPHPDSGISPSNISLATIASIEHNEKVIFSSPKNMKRISQPVDCDPPIHESASTNQPVKSTGLTFGTFSLKSIKPPSSLQIKDATPKHFSFQPQTEQKISSYQDAFTGSLPTEQKPENQISESFDESQNSKDINEGTSSLEKEDIDGVLQKENDVQNLPATHESQSNEANKEPVSILINKVELLKGPENITDISLSKDDSSPESKNAKENHTDSSEEKDQSETPKSVSDSPISKNESSLEKTQNKISKNDRDSSMEREQSSETPKTQNKISKNAKIIHHTDSSEDIHHTDSFKEKDQSTETPESVSDGSISKNEICLESKNAKENHKGNPKNVDQSADTPITQNKISMNAKIVQHTDSSNERDQLSEAPRSVSESSVSKNDNSVEKTITKIQNCCAIDNTNATNINQTVFSTANGSGDFFKENESTKPNVPNKDQLLQAPESVLDISENKTDMSSTKTEKPSSNNKNDVKDSSKEQKSEVSSEKIKVLEPKKDQAPEKILDSFASKDDILEKTVKTTPSTKKGNKIVKKLFECPSEKRSEEMSKEKVASNGSIENKDQLSRTSTENVLNKSFSKIDQQPIEKTIQKSTCSRKENKNVRKNMNAEKSSENFSDEKICLNGNILKTPTNEKTVNKEKTSILHSKFELRHFNIRLSKNIVAKLMQTEKNTMSPKTLKNISKNEVSRDILGSINNVVVNSICAPIEKPEKSLMSSPASSEIKVKGRRGRKRKIIQPVETPPASTKCLPPMLDGINSEVKEKEEASVPKLPNASAKVLDSGKKKSVVSPMTKLTNESVLNSTDEVRFEKEVTLTKSSPGLRKEINSLPSIPDLTKKNISNQPLSSNGIISEGKEEGIKKLSGISVKEKKSLRPVPVSRRDSPSNLRCLSQKNTLQSVNKATVKKAVDILQKETNILPDQIKRRVGRPVSKKATRQTTLQAKETSQPQRSEVPPVPALKPVKERNLIMRKELTASETPAALTDVSLSNKINVEPNKNTKSPLDDVIIVEPKKELDDETLVPQCKTTNLAINASLLDAAGNKIKSSESLDANINRNLSGLNIYPNSSGSFGNEQAIREYTVFELPSYIVMKTKIITRKELESNKRIVPPTIKQQPDSESEDTPTEPIVKTERPEFNTVCAQINSLLEQNANYLKFASGSERLTRMNNVLADDSLSAENARCTLKFLQSYLSSGPRDKAIKTKGQQFIPIYDSQKKIIGYRKRTIHSKPNSSSSSLSSRRNSRRTSKLITQPSFSLTTTTVNVFQNPNGNQNNPQFSTKIEPESMEGVDSEMIVPDAAPSNVTNLSIKSEDKNLEEQIAGP